MSVPVGTDDLLHVGAQFYPQKDASNPANVPKASRSSVTRQAQNQLSSFQEDFERFMQIADRTELSASVWGFNRLVPPGSSIMSSSVPSTK